MKHTPGPWIVAERVPTARIDNARMVRPVDDRNYEYGATAIIGTNEANARLIAAAPDMLDALLTLMENYENVDGLGFNMLAVAKACRAIAKATGEKK
jgi:hypothetical protein